MFIEQDFIDEADAPRSKRQCRRHPGRVTYLYERTADFDAVVEDLLYGGCNVELDGVLLCPRCLGWYFIDIVVAARRKLKAAGITMPITRHERGWLALDE